MKDFAISLIMAMTILACQCAFAHHSFAMFDLTKEVNLQGEVKEFQWTNPHVWIQLLVADGKGSKFEWSLEGGAPGMLSRTGWNSRMLKPGDRISIVMHPLKNGDPSGSLVSVTLPDGRVMGPGGPALPAAGSSTQ